jgi:hypothetical protein
MSYFHYLCLLANSVVLFVYLSLSCVLFIQFCNFLWIVHFLMAPSFSLIFI